MGRRYQAILESFREQDDIEILKSDIFDEDKTSKFKKIKACDGIIITSPTECHANHLLETVPFGKPILCEKPMVKPDILDLIVKQSRFYGTELNMVMQYRWLDFGLGGDSYYNYYKTGNDGMIWDCIQILGLAKGALVLRQDSPVWLCALNGKELNYSDMDGAYITEIKNWVMNRMTNIEQAIAFHEKAQKLEDMYGSTCNSLHWHPST